VEWFGLYSLVLPYPDGSMNRIVRWRDEGRRLGKICPT
jgi:hypothetical protein